MYFTVSFNTAKLVFEKPKSWDLWVDYLNSDRSGIQEFLVSGNWRTENLLGVDYGVTSWGVGGELYVYQEFRNFSYLKSFNSKLKDRSGNLSELTRVQFVFVF